MIAIWILADPLQEADVVSHRSDISAGPTRVNVELV